MKVIEFWQKYLWFQWSFGQNFNKIKKEQKWKTEDIFIEITISKSSALMEFGK